jgi:hypothetical protein
MDQLKPLMHQLEVFQVLLSLTPLLCLIFQIQKEDQPLLMVHMHQLFLLKVLFLENQQIRRRNRQITRGCSKKNGLPNFLGLNLW